MCVGGVMYSFENKILEWRSETVIFDTFDTDRKDTLKVYLSISVGKLQECMLG